MTAVMEKTNLVVPMGFVEIDSEEMTYIEGGLVKFYLSRTQVVEWTRILNGIAGISGLGIGIAAIKTKLRGVASAAAANIVKMSASIGGAIGLIAGVIGAIVVAANIVSFGVGLYSALEMGTGVEMRWWVASFGGFKYR